MITDNFDDDELSSQQSDTEGESPRVIINYVMNYVMSETSMRRRMKVAKIRR